MMDDYVPRRYLTRRKLTCASGAEQRFRKAVLEAAAELSHEFSEHYWKEVLQKGEAGASGDQLKVSASTSESIMKGFLFYLNASGRYLVLREHLRSAICTLVQQKCLNMRPSGFHNHRDLQAYLHDMYIFLVDEMHEVLNNSTLQETDPLRNSLDRLLQQTNCEKDQDLSKASLHQRHITDLGIFAEEAFAQGDFESCHKLHLQRTCKDKESARCWTEFAVKWLSKGNDRMAEIAAREALLKDPLNLYALIISGIISIRHGDERGLECLGAASGLKPMSPEILAICGLANSMTGNEGVADSFFKKAAHVHRVITGRSTQDLDKIFSSKKGFNMKEFINEMDTAPPPTVHAVTVNLASIQHGEESPIHHDESQALLRKQSKRSKTRQSMRQSKTEVNEMENAPAENAAVKKKRRSTGKNSTTVEADLPPASTSDVLRKESSTTKKKRKSSDKNSSTSIGEEHPHQSSKFNFQDALGDLKPDQVELPLLIPSILSPWDITEYCDKMARHLQSLSYLGVGPGTKKNSPPVSSSKTPPSDEQGIAPDNQPKDEYDKLVERKGSKTSKGSKTVVGTASNDGVRRLSKRSSGVNEHEKGQGDTNGQPVPESPSPSPPTELTNRLGSELIWAANLLINLRLFDFVDGILAKDLFFYGSRTIQFLYLRALSLYLRQREVEALRLLKEAIDLDSTNGRLLALEGHCYYSQGKTDEAMSSYEKALKLPHTNENRHLLYLRYGSLVLDSGKTKLAKRVFLHGVSKYPTPYMWLALGSVCLQRNEHDQAESAFSEANRLDNTNPITWGHLAITSLIQDKKELAEQAYKWAMRFGLKKGTLLEEIQRLQKEKGFGDPSFPRLPNCLPHDYFLRRMGKLKPFNLYKEGLDQDKPRMGKERYADTQNELLMKKKLELMAAGNKVEQTQYAEDEWDGEDDTAGNYFVENREEGYGDDFATGPAASSTPRADINSPPDLLTIKDPPPPPPSPTPAID